MFAEPLDADDHSCRREGTNTVSETGSGECSTRISNPRRRSTPLVVLSHDVSGDTTNVFLLNKKELCGDSFRERNRDSVSFEESVEC